ncbi:MAG: carbohydrate porin [Leptolyngbya sp. SIO3F4]|nr:carbohydrate porin [Leptolyngbya sp. SIO3F4]
MRDIARNFQALPLVSWMVWMAMAVIAAPVMALTTENISEVQGFDDIASVASNFETMLLAQQSEINESIEEESLEEEAADIIIKVIEADESEPEIDADTADTSDEADSILLVSEDSSELASPSDPFFFNENSVEATTDGVLAPLSETEVLPEGIEDGEAELDDGPLTPPQLRLQTAAIQEGDDFSARARVYGHYFLRSNVAVVGAVDLSTGNAFSDTDSTGFNISELYVVASPPNAPELRGAVGLIELTSFFDRNSFAKDSLTHFINPVFQTNPALAATQLESQPAALLHWRPIDEVILKAAAFSSGGFDDLDFNAVAGEIGVNVGNLIVRGTYVSATDDGDRDGILESFQINRNGVFGPQEGDREVAYGINAEWFIPELNAGLFGRYGYQRNTDLDISGNTYSFGVNFLDLFIDDDRFGIGYGRQLSDDDRRQGDRPDVLETFYDIRLAPNARAAVSWQLRDEFSESVLGFRIRADWDLLELFD